MIFFDDNTIAYVNVSTAIVQYATVSASDVRANLIQVPGADNVFCPGHADVVAGVMSEIQVVDRRRVGPVCR